MAAQALYRVLEYPGRLSYGCTNFATAFPHGGTELGFCDEIVLVYSAPIHLVIGEEWGIQPVEGVHCGEMWAVTCLLRDQDDAAKGLAWLNSAIDTDTTQKRVITGAPTATNRAGSLLSARSVVLAFTPESVIQGYEDAHDMFVFYRALPSAQGAQELKHRLNIERPLGLAFYAIPDTALRCVKWGPRRGLTNP